MRAGSGLAAVLADTRSPLLALARVPADSDADTALRVSRGAVILYTRTRAMLRSPLGYDDYINSLRGKKRKELRRLRARLEDRGALKETLFGGQEDLADWTEDFLRLEAMGWKGSAGTAMARRDAERGYLTLLLQGARDAGALRLFRLCLDGQPVAMLIGLLGADGGLYAYKIAHDPAYDRYSPGVLVALFATRHVLGSNDIAYADSCAKEGHAMIEQLWAERRTLHDWAVPTNAVGRAITAMLVAIGKARRP